MIADRVLTLRTVLDRVSTLDNIPVLIQVVILPLDELAVPGVDGDKLPPPVDRESRLLHRPPVLLREVTDDLHRVDEPVQDILRHPVEVAVEPDRLFITACYPLRYPDDRGSGDVKRHREEDRSSLHPLVSGDDIRDDIGPPVPDVHRSTRIRVCHRQVKLLLLCRISLERMLPSDDAFSFVNLDIKSTHSIPPISGSRILSHTGRSRIVSPSL